MKIYKRGDNIENRRTKHLQQKVCGSKLCQTLIWFNIWEFFVWNFHLKQCCIDSFLQMDLRHRHVRKTFKEKTRVTTFSPQKLLDLIFFFYNFIISDKADVNTTMGEFPDHSLITFHKPVVSLFFLWTDHITRVFEHYHHLWMSWRLNNYTLLYICRRWTLLMCKDQAIIQILTIINQKNNQHLRVCNGILSWRHLHCKKAFL